VYSHNQVPILVLHILEADISEDAGVVEEDINAAKIINGSLDDSIAILDAVVVGDGFAACSLDFVNYNIGGL
jgi:hypothetical protein